MDSKGGKSIVINELVDENAEVSNKRFRNLGEKKNLKNDIFYGKLKTSSPNRRPYSAINTVTSKTRDRLNKSMNKPTNDPFTPAKLSRDSYLM